MLASQDAAAAQDAQSEAITSYDETDTLANAPIPGENDGSKASNYGSSAEIATNTADGKAAPAGAVLNFVNSIIGAGIIGLPFALREAGIIGGLL